jgi:cholinesterase
MQVSPSLATIVSTNITNSGAQILAQLGQIGDNFSEDCLTVNIWSKPQVGEPKKAVLVWIYGGGFTTGNSDNKAYNGQFIAEQEDVVLVSFNYRLNAFGFPGNPNGTQNLGLLDQRLAIEWIRDNVASFGGDPSRITLFGQSAGSASVDYYTYAWTKDPIAHGFIEESGSVFGPAGGLGAISADTAATYWFNLTSALKCGNKDSDQAATLACMKSKSETSILNAAAVVSGNSAGPIASSFGPTVDETVVFSDYLQRSTAGNFTKLPLLLGNADYEAGLFKVLDAFRNVSMPDTYWDGFNDVVFTCPCAERANVSISSQVPTWRYRWFGAFPNTQLTTVPYSGAWHASELPVLFGNVPFGSGVANNTDAEVQIGSYLRGAWAAFAKNPTDGLTTYRDGWPLYVPDKKTLVRLAYQNMTGANLATGSMYDQRCPPVVNYTASQSSPGTPNSTAPGMAASTGGAGPSRILTKSSLVLVVVFVIGLAIL